MSRFAEWQNRRREQGAMSAALVCAYPEKTIKKARSVERAFEWKPDTR